MFVTMVTGVCERETLFAVKFAGPCKPYVCWELGTFLLY